LITFLQVLLLYLLQLQLLLLLLLLPPLPLPPPSLDHMPSDAASEAVASGL
jgi:hypothetical protein